MKIQEWGLIEKYDSRDYFLGWENKTFINKFNPYQKLQEFNQMNETIHRNSCTIFGWMWSVGYNSWIKFTQHEVEKASQRAIDDWVVDPNYWATFIGAVNFLRKYCKKTYDLDLISFRIPVDSEEFKNALDNKWACMIWYRTSNTLNNDIQKNWIAEEKNYPKWNWHLVYYIYKSNDEYVINSYKWRKKYNQFRFKYFSDLLENWVLFQYAYILIPNNIKMDILPLHIIPENINQQEDRQIAIERQRILSKAITEKNQKPIYKSYIDNKYITKMLIEIALLRDLYWTDF